MGKPVGSQVILPLSLSLINLLLFIDLEPVVSNFRSGDLAVQQGLHTPLNLDRGRKSSACAGDLELLERAPVSPVGESCISRKKSALRAIKLKKALK